MALDSHLVKDRRALAARHADARDRAQGRQSAPAESADALARQVTVIPAQAGISDGTGVNQALNRGKADAPA